MYPQNGFNQPQQMMPVGNYPQNFPANSAVPNPQYSPMRSIGANLAMPSMIQGRMIQDISEVQPSEVPMDGSVSLFPRSDYTAIFAKIWDQNGNIQTFKFVPEVEVMPEPEVDTSFRDEVIGRLENIESIIKRNNGYHRRKNYNKQSKEENDNE